MSTAQQLVSTLPATCCDAAHLDALFARRSAPIVSHVELLVYGLAITAAAAIYLCPSIVAGVRNSRSALAILCLNAMLGWTVLGWIFAGIWAISSPPPDDRAAKDQPAEATQAAG